MSSYRSRPVQPVSSTVHTSVRLTNHPAFTGIIPQNELVSRHPGKKYEYPAF